MNDPKDEPAAPPRGEDGHSQRVHAAFDDLHAGLGGRATSETTASVEKLRTAALARDADGIRSHLESVKESHGWLYTELTKHPAVAALVNELALMGF